MGDRALAALFVVGVWWLSTGVVLGLVWLGRSTFRATTAVFSVIALAGLVELRLSSTATTTGAAYLAFASAIAVWAWHELTFLLGAITGPRKLPCPPDAHGWTRFWLATSAVIHHEVALAATLLVVVALAWHQPNQVGVWTFAAMWLMRLSAKLNVFLGVRNVSEEFVPDHLRYLLSYFRRARLNALMPVTVVVGSAVVVWLTAAAFAPDASAFRVVGSTLVATIVALAVVEHLFLALPVPDATLWRWIIRSRSGAPRSVNLREAR